MRLRTAEGRERSLRLPRPKARTPRATLGLRALLALVRDATEAAAAERAGFDAALRRELEARLLAAGALPRA